MTKSFVAGANNYSSTNVSPLAGRNVTPRKYENVQSKVAQFIKTSPSGIFRTKKTSMDVSGHKHNFDSTQKLKLVSSQSNKKLVQGTPKVL